MAENESNLVTLKVTEEQRDWAAEEQFRLKRAGAGKVSQAGLFQRMKEAYLSQIGAPSETPMPSDNSLKVQNDSPAKEPGKDPGGMLQLVESREHTAWEHRAVDTILKTDFADAFRVNIRAVYLLATGREPDASVEPVADAGEEHLPAGSLEDLRRKSTDARAFARDAAADIKEHQAPRKRHRSPKEGTA